MNRNLAFALTCLGMSFAGLSMEEKIFDSQGNQIECGSELALTIKSGNGESKYIVTLERVLRSYLVRENHVGTEETSPLSCGRITSNSSLFDKPIGYLLTQEEINDLFYIQLVPSEKKSAWLISHQGPIFKRVALEFKGIIHGKEQKIIGVAKQKEPGGHLVVSKGSISNY